MRCGNVELVLSDALDLFDYGGRVWLVFPNSDAEFASSIAGIYRCYRAGGCGYASTEEYEAQFGENVGGW